MPPGDFSRSVLRSQARKMVYNVLQFMMKEAEEGVQIELSATRRRTSAATGVSVRTIARITKEAKESSKSLLFKTPGKNRRGKFRKTAISSLDQGYVKRRIHHFHITEKQLPSVHLLLSQFKKEIGFQGALSSFRRVIKNLGFTWKRTKEGKQVLIEHTTTRFKRIDYLGKLTKFRAQGRPIIFTGDSCVHLSQFTSKSWGDGSSDTLRACPRPQRIAIINAASEEGFVPNTLYIFTTDTKTGECMTYDTYENWVRTQLIPNLPEKSVVVVGNASYHNKFEDTAPSSIASRSAMETWLMDNEIPHSSTMLKPELYKLISLHKEKLKKYEIDRILKENGHTVLRIPPFHPDLNPMDLAWPTITAYVTENGAMFTVDKVIRLIEDKMEEFGSKKWGALCQTVKKIEEEYKESDVVIDNLTEALTIHVSDDESSMSVSEDEEDDDESVSSSDEEAPSASGF